MPGPAARPRDSPPLGPAVLKPGLDLGVGHLERLGERRPLGRGQVLLPVETLLQLADLHPREGGAGLLALGRSAVLVGVPDPPGHREGRERRRCCDRKGDRVRQGGRRPERAPYTCSLWGRRGRPLLSRPAPLRWPASGSGEARTRGVTRSSLSESPAARSTHGWGVGGLDARWQVTALPRPPFLPPACLHRHHVLGRGAKGVACPTPCVSPAGGAVGRGGGSEAIPDRLQTYNREGGVCGGVCVWVGV